jgi:hypothetical protein
MKIGSSHEVRQKDRLIFDPFAMTITLVAKALNRQCLPLAARTFQPRYDSLTQGESMAGFEGIITQLENQKAAIDKALTALRNIGGIAPTPVAEVLTAPTAAKGRMTPEGKERLVAALKKRWAAKKRAARKAPPVKAAPVAVTAPAVTEKRKPNFTPEGRKRLADAMKKRWAVKRAASVVKKSGGKKAA